MTIGRPARALITSALAASSLTTPPPTLPRPAMPMRKGVVGGEVIEGSGWVRRRLCGARRKMQAARQFAAGCRPDAVKKMRKMRLPRSCTQRNPTRPGVANAGFCRRQREGAGGGHEQRNPGRFGPCRTAPPGLGRHPADEYLAWNGLSVIGLFEIGLPTPPPSLRAAADGASDQAASARRRRAKPPARPKPRMNCAQMAGSGTPNTGSKARPDRFLK